MATRVADILVALEAIAPFNLAFGFDKIGLQIGKHDAPVTRGVVSLDRSLAAVRFAREAGAQLLLSHHPLIWEPMKAITDRDHPSLTALELIESGIAFVAAHTNWDCAIGGVNDTLAERLGLGSVTPFGEAASEERLKLVVFCPEDHADAVIDAVAGEGGGVIGDYERCAFLTDGRGTFTPRESASPFVGRAGERTTANEIRIEMELPVSARTAAVRAMLAVHPYEEVAYDLLLTHPKPLVPIGRFGRLKAPHTLAEFVSHIDTALGTKSLAWGLPEKPIQTVGVVGGAAGGEWRAAQAAGCDAFVTGEIQQHIALEAAEAGFTVVQAGHYATEQPGCEALRGRLKEAVPSVDWILFEPKPGDAGRPT